MPDNRRNENQTDSEAKCWFCCCCLYGTSCLPVNLTWSLIGLLFLLYDKPGMILPKQLSTLERACFPLDHAAKKNIACSSKKSRTTNSDELSGFAAFAPYFWMWFFYEEISCPTSKKEKFTRPTAPHFHNPMSAPSMELSEIKIQPT